MIPRDWYVVHNQHGMRLMVQALDIVDARSRGRERWLANDAPCGNSTIARPASESEIAEHIASVNAFVDLARRSPPPPYSLSHDARLALVPGRRIAA